MPVIELKKLTKFFGAVPAVLEASLTVEEGDFFGFVGPNGSGKSTTIRMMMNYVRPTSGTATILGMDSRSQSGKLKKMVGYVPSEVDYYMDMRAMEVIRYAAAMRGLRDKSRIDQLCDLFEVDTVRRISHMSLGNRKKIALVTALLHSPKLLILDEPTSGLDSLIKRRFKDLLVEENQKGATIFFCNHDIGEVQELCGRTAIIRKGSILEVANTDNLSSSDTRRVKLKTTDNLSALFTLFQINDPVVTGDLVTFSYRGVMDPFIKALANYEIQDLQVSLPSLEDAIIRFYEKSWNRRPRIMPKVFSLPIFTKEFPALCPQRDFMVPDQRRPAGLGLIFLFCRSSN